MIWVEYRRSVPEMTFCGHAGYAPAGQDIVCAGVSALFGALARSLQRKEDDGSGTLEIREEDGGWHVAFHTEGRAQDEIREIFETISDGLQLMEETYPEYLSLRRSVGCGERPVPDDKMRP